MSSDENSKRKSYLFNNLKNGISIISIIILKSFQNRVPEFFIKSWIYKSFSDASAGADATNKIAIFK